MSGTIRPLRSDAERTVRTILEAAERVFGSDPAASMEQVAEAAGVARTTVHRRFASRDALLGALGAVAAREFAAAVEAARPETTPPLVAFYQVTVNVLRVKRQWPFALNLYGPEHEEPARVHAEVEKRCDELFKKAQDCGVLRADADLIWARKSYYALIGVAARMHEYDIDEAASRVVDTLLGGVGTGQGLVRPRQS
ncbi:helix-turn-helix domain-containing protein [Nonomuraea sp. N2-4H]|uniref:TetR/AcrR family transcriptional regulator n=1 Tax=unclassified Nonomuraea TaxID=2593643 RepID=UPI00325441A8